MEEALEGTDAQLVELARAEVAEVLNCRDEPLFERVFRWIRGMPQYTMGHLERVATLRERAEQHPGLFLAGNYLQGVGLPDCIASGEHAAESALTQVSSTRLLRSVSGDDRR
jgi:oxygen-dependent protoporphyrinogen oxidase